MYRVRHLLCRFRCAAVITLATMSPAPQAAAQHTATAWADTLGEASVMTMMETPAAPGAIRAFQKSAPAPFWLFGEHRRFAVRRNIIPAHWFSPAAQSHGRFTGTASPGEFYVFQIAVLAGDTTLQRITLEPAELRFQGPPAPAAPAISATAVRCLSLGGIDHTGRTFQKDLSIAPGHLMPLWMGIPIPPDAHPGSYAGTFTVKANGLALPFAVELTVAGETLTDHGIGDAWRLARLHWLDSRIAQGDSLVTRPFTPVVVDRESRVLGILGRRIAIGETGIPAQYTSFFSAGNTALVSHGRDAFTGPPSFVCEGAAPWRPASFAFTRITPAAVTWRAASEGGPLTLEVEGTLEYDGFLSLRMALIAAADVAPHDIRLTIPWKQDAARYVMGLGLTGRERPASFTWRWDVTKHQDALWVGDVNTGLMLRFKDERYQRPLINLYYESKPLLLPRSWGTGGVSLREENGMVICAASTGPRTIRAGDTLHFHADWHFTPFKTIDTRKHFTDRYYHTYQGNGLEDPAWLRSQGVTIVNIHHNKEANPFINYPYGDESLPVLRDYIARAHAESLRVKIYYTTRELTQNLPEFFALLGMNGEIILPRKPGVPWTIINPEGPHPWLRQHVGTDIIPAWKETITFPRYGGRLDLAVITTPESRWNNFYLEGLRHLVRTAGIDGLYVDDTALDRISMRRARHILDEDGTTGRRIDMHSWNHFNAMAGYANCSILFMEHYPYYDRLWHGEMFDARMPADYWLVEMSGIPFGLMSEMLQDGGNPWRGMLFGMTQRWPWSGDPRPLWKVMDRFRIADASFTGWWDPACPVRTDTPGVLASVYRHRGRSMIAVASWADKPVQVVLRTASGSVWPADLHAPEIEHFQSSRLVRPGMPVTIEPGKGLLLLTDH